MKWYAYDENDTSYTMILDHNTTARSYYNYSGNGTDMGTRTASELSEIAGTSIIYNEIGYDLQELTSTSHWVVEPRLITGQEIANIIKYTTWSNSPSWVCFDTLDHQCYNETNGGVDLGKGNSKYSWLFDYTNDCQRKGCNINDTSNYGYWTGTVCSSNSAYVWRVRNLGYFDGYYYAYQTGSGLRPVITVSKSALGV